MGDLSKWKNTEIFQKVFHCNGWPIQVEKYEDFSEEVSLYWVIYPVEKYKDFSERVSL
jgi:hypothetical protein